jgi:glucose-1-phosphate thymidylyltransferase
MKNNRKGIILAGGTATRLFPLTKVISKQLFPVFDKPMIYYPLSNLISIGIKDILIISTKYHINYFRNLLGNGSNLGINLQYKIQLKPDGIAKALIIGEKFLNKSDLVLILGDNIFFGNDFNKFIKIISFLDKSSIVVKEIKNPNKYGVLKIDKNNNPIDIIEKPKTFISNLAVTGIYFYENDVIKIAKNLNPSQRGELEITDLNKELLKNSKLKVFKMKKNHSWYDAGSYHDYLKVSNEIFSYEKKNKTKIGSVDYESYKNKNITKEKLVKRIKEYKSSYYIELLNLLMK